MPYPGSRTTATELWLLPADEALLDQRIDEVLPGAGWRCSHPGPPDLHQVHLHRTVEQAMTCGGVQAFLPLPAGAALVSVVEPVAELEPRSGTPSQASVQLLRSAIYEDDLGEHFRSGRLAVQWFEPEVGPEMHHLLTEQTRLIWTALRAATRPAAVVHDQTGQRVRGLRIGAEAHKLITDRRLALTRGGWSRYHLA